MNHWTDEQDKRQLEMWSDRHPVLAGLLTLGTLPFFVVIILGGIVVVLLSDLWKPLPHWLREVLKFGAVLSLGLFGFYWLLYAGLWLCGKLLAGGV